MGVVDLNGIRLRNRLVTSASLLGYGASKRRLILYGLSPIAQWVPLERFGAVTTRTMTLEPREGHFTLREDWGITEFPAMLRLYGKALRRVDAGWLNAFGWSNIGIERYFDEYFERTAGLNRIVSIGGFSADEIERLVEIVNERAKPGEIAAIELNASCHNVNFPFDTILEESLARAVPRSRHPVILKVSPDEDYVGQARMAERFGCAGITAINTVKGLRLDPETGEPWLKNRYGAVSGPAIKPIGLRVVAGASRRGHPAADHRQRRDPRLRRLPGVRLGGRRCGQPRVVRSGCSGCRSMRSGRSEGLRIRRLIARMAAFVPPDAAPHWQPAAAEHASGPEVVAEPVAGHHPSEVARLRA